MKHTRLGKLTALLMALCMILAILPMSAVAASAKSSGKSGKTINLSDREIRSAISDISKLLQSSTDLSKLGKTLTIDLNSNTVDNENGTPVRSDKVLQKAAKKSYGNALKLLNQYDYLDVIDHDKTNNTITVLDPYQTKRILVRLDKLSKSDKKGTSEVLNLRKLGLSILQYDSETAVRKAYAKLKAKYGSAVILDRTFQLDDTEQNAKTVRTKTAGPVSAQKLSGEDNYLSWGVKDMGLDKMQNALNKRGNLSRVTVAVIDSGINALDPAFNGRIALGGYSFVTFLPVAQDVYGHGSNVSGIICDCTTSNVKVLPIQTINASGTGSTTQTYLGLLYATYLKPDVINMSIASKASSDYDAYNDLFTKLVNNGTVICAAAGNEHTAISTSYPARSSKVICVGATKENGQVDTSYSNTGKELDFVAPGTAIYGPYVYMLMTARAKMTGTSMATPHVAGAAALLKTCNKKLTQKQIYNIFKDNTVDLNSKGFDNTSGWGKINLADYAKTID